MIQIVWEFQVELSKVATFENMYGPGGAWAALFRQSPVTTVLLYSPMLLTRADILPLISGVKLRRLTASMPNSPKRMKP